MEKRNPGENMELGQRVVKCWFILVSLAAAVIFSYPDLHAMLRPDSAHPTLLTQQAFRDSHSPLLPVGLNTAFTMLFFAVGLTFSSSMRQALDLTALGSIPDTEEDDYPDKLVVVKATLSPAAEAYRVLHTNLKSNSADQPLQTLIVTSSFPLEGKSAAAANLAAVIAQSGKRVILVDADLRHPIQHRIFELENQVGLVDALRQDTPLDNVLQNVQVENLRVLPSGLPTEDPSDLLDSKRMQQVIESLRQETDVVIIDSPPVTALPDAKMLATRLGGALLVIESTKAPRNLAQRGKDALDRFGTQLSGAASDRLAASGEDYYYYRYYSDHGSSSGPAVAGLPAHPSDQLGSRPGQAGALAKGEPGGELDTRRFEEPADVGLLRARLNLAIRRLRARSAIGALLLVAIALIIVTITSISSLSKQQQNTIGNAATRAILAAQTASVNQTATAIARETDVARRTAVAATQTAGANAAAATATQKAIVASARQTPTPVDCNIDIEILQSPTHLQSVTAAIANVELIWRVRNRATSPACKWGTTGQETRLLRAVEVGGELGAEVLVQLTWIQDDEYDLSLKIPLTVGEHNLVWRLISPGARSPSGPDLIARVVVATPTFTPPPTIQLAPTDCPVEVYDCNCSEECGPRGCKKICDVCTRPKCD
jgi:protein-tyrosine kinase